MKRSQSRDASPEHSIFRHKNGVSVEVFTGDALKLSADAAVFGKCPRLHGQLESLAHDKFRPFGLTTVGKRPLSILKSDRVPWRRSVSLRYRARSGFGHIARLSEDLFFLLRDLSQRFKARTLLVLPLSWQNPDAVAVATIGAIWYFAQCSRRSGNRRRKFLLGDLDDPSPFLRALENRDDCLTATMQRCLKTSWFGLGDSEIDRAWREAPFVREERTFSDPTA